MRAARFHEWGGDPVVEDVPAPVRRPGQTLVRVLAAAVSHLDLTVASGDFGIRPDLPHTGGVEAAGVVVESDTHSEGTLVSVRGDGLGLRRDGGWSDYVVAADDCVSPAPSGMAPTLVATYRQPLATAAVTLFDVAGLGDSGESEVVVVTGAAGAVGSMTAQLALRAGHRVLGLVRDEQQAARLPAGVEPVRAGDDHLSERLARERPATLLVDVLGGPELATRLGWVAPGGRAAVVGYVAGTAATLDLPRWLLADVSLLPVNMMRHPQASQRRAAELAPLVTAGELAVAVERFSLEEAAAAVARLRAGGVRGRVVLEPQATTVDGRRHQS